MPATTSWRARWPTRYAADGGWYADFTSSDHHVVVFAGRVFRYRRGDAAAQAEARAYGRSLGVPDHQLDWSED